MKFTYNYDPSDEPIENTETGEKLAAYNHNFYQLQREKITEQQFAAKEMLEGHKVPLLLIVCGNAPAFN